LILDASQVLILDASQVLILDASQVLILDALQAVKNPLFGTAGFSGMLLADVPHFRASGCPMLVRQHSLDLLRFPKI
jgi:hypothetical protein